MTAPSDSQCPLNHRVAVVIPCYNAGPRLRPVVEGALRRSEAVVVVDDGCTDACTEGLEALGVRVLRFERNRGKGHALLAGFRTALEDPATKALCCLDADGQHRPDDIGRLAAASVEQSADLVIGQRTFQEGQVPWRSWFGNTVTVAVTGWLLGRPMPDTQCGFRLLSRRFAEAVVADVTGGRYETEMEILVKAVREGYALEYVPIETVYEAGNPSSHFRSVRDSMLIYRRLWQATRRRHH